MINLPWREFVYGNNLDELLQMRVKDPDEAGGVGSIDAGDDEIVVSEQYADDELIGRMIIIDDGTHRGQFYITDNGTNTIVVNDVGSDDIDLEDFSGTITYEIVIVYTYHADAQGNIVAISDADGRVVEKYAYDVYGRLTGAEIWDEAEEEYVAVATGGGFVSMAASRTIEK